MIDAEGFLRSLPDAVTAESADTVNAQKSGDVPRGVRMALSAHADTADGGEKDGRDACRESALRLLDAAPRSSQAMRERLLDKDYSTEVVDDVVDALMRVGLIDDERYARMLLDHCLERCMGSRGVAREFSRRRVERDMTENLLVDARREGLFLQSARRMAEAVKSRARGCDRRTCLRRLWAAAGRKGHDCEDVRIVARELFDEK